jgi:hypothetical protein
VVEAAGDVTAEEAGGFEDSKVFGDGGKGHGEGRSECGDGGCALGEAGEDGAAGGVGEGREGGVQGAVWIVNHTV